MSIEQLLQRHYGAALAVITAKFNDLDLAEECLQDAAVKAIENWHESQPDNPTAWLIRVAQNAAIDRFRKTGRQETSQLDLFFAQDDEQPLIQEDAVLQLIFMCCHPALTPEQQVAMTLKLVMGFSNNEIAKSFIIPEKTLEQRITRAKKKIRSTGIALSLPGESRLKIRLPSVLQVLYLIFNEGYHSQSADNVLNRRLCTQAISLLRITTRIYRSEADCYALLALMLFIDARSPARGVDEIITLEEQDRSRWDKNQILQADVLLKKSLKLGKVSSYTIQAAISGVHSMAESFAATDWLEINLLYDKLMQYQPGPVVMLNKAVSHLMLDEDEKAFSLIESCRQNLSSYTAFYATEALYYRQLEQFEMANNSLNIAIELSDSPIEIAYFKQKQALLHS